MTKEQTELFVAVENTLAALGASFEDMCEAYAEAFRDDATEQTNDTVKSCLISAADHLQSAGMDWYVSTK